MTASLPWDARPAGELLADVCRFAAETLQPRATSAGNPSAWPLESQLEQAIVDGLLKLGVARSHIGARRQFIAHDWDPLPGGIDLYVWSRPDREFSLVAELKLENIEESQWDLYKLLAAHKLPGAPTTCLVNAAYAARWRRQPPCAALFPSTSGETVELDSRELFRRNRTQWQKDLRYSGRPLSVPTSVQARCVLAGVRLQHYPELELRVSEVRALDPTPIYCQDGWPV